MWLLPNANAFELSARRAQTQPQSVRHRNLCACMLVYALGFYEQRCCCCWAFGQRVITPRRRRDGQHRHKGKGIAQGVYSSLPGNWNRLARSWCPAGIRNVSMGMFYMLAGIVCVCLYRCEYVTRAAQEKCNGPHCTGRSWSSKFIC